MIQNESHRAYTDFYTQFHPGEVQKPATGIPLHLSKRWEGRFDDLVIYSDREAEVLGEVFEVLNLAPSLRVLSVKMNEDTGLPEYFYKQAPPFTAMIPMGNRRALTSRLMADAQLRKLLIDEIARREHSLSPTQISSYFWALQAQYVDPELDHDTPDFQILREEVKQVYARAQALAAEGSAPAPDPEQMPHANQLAWLRSQSFGLQWESSNQPTVNGLELWRRP